MKSHCFVKTATSGEGPYVPPINLVIGKLREFVHFACFSSKVFPSSGSSCVSSVGDVNMYVYIYISLPNPQNFESNICLQSVEVTEGKTKKKKIKKVKV